MHLFGVTFILYLFQMSDGKGHIYIYIAAVWVPVCLPVSICLPACVYLSAYLSTGVIFLPLTRENLLMRYFLFAEVINLINCWQFCCYILMHFLIKLLWHKNLK